MSANKASEEVVCQKADDDEEEDSEAVLSLFTESTESEVDAEQILSDEDILQPSVNVDDVNDDDDGDDDYDDGDGIPWHHMQLYQLYGDEADYFLHPKLIRTDKEVRVKPSVLLKSLCGDCSLDNMGIEILFLSLFHNIQTNCRINARNFKLRELLMRDNMAIGQRGTKSMCLEGTNPL